jgi:hypothetical protein
MLLAQHTRFILAVQAISARLMPRITSWFAALLLTGCLKDIMFMFHPPGMNRCP